MTFEYRDHTGDALVVHQSATTSGPEVAIRVNDGVAVYVPPARVEEVIAGIRDAARQASGQQPDTRPCVCDTEPEACTAVGEPDPATADDPVQLRWGLGDVLHSDDDTRIVCLSGPDREPYWLELDPERAAALRDDLAGPETEEKQDHPAAELYVLLRKAGEDRDTAQELIYAHARMVIRQHEALNDEPAAGLSDTQPTNDRAAVLREAADRIAALDPVEAALAGYRAWDDAADLLRRMADEETSR